MQQSYYYPTFIFYLGVCFLLQIPHMPNAHEYRYELKLGAWHINDSKIHEPSTNHCVGPQLQPARHSHNT